MPRTIVYASRRTEPNVIARGAGSGAGTAEQDKGDGYTERLSKYIPAEVLAGFIPLVGLTADRGGLLLFAFVIGLAATVLYLYIRALQETDKTKRPRLFFYGFAAIAFIVWAFGTSEQVRALFGIDEIVARFALAITAFALPVADLAIDLTIPRK